MYRRQVRIAISKVAFFLALRHRGHLRNEVEQRDEESEEPEDGERDERRLPAENPGPAEKSAADRAAEHCRQRQ